MRSILPGLRASHEQSFPFTWAGAGTGAVVAQGQLSPGGQLSAWAVVTWAVVAGALVAWGVVGAPLFLLGSLYPNLLIDLRIIKKYYMWGYIVNTSIRTHKII